jgi:ABC-type branched-subunit amino acid transport system substrate-binding protein
MHEIGPRKRALFAILLVLGAATALSACGGGTSSQSGSTSSTSGTKGPAPTGAPIKVMVAGTLSGPTNLPELPYGAISAAEQINAEGGIDERPIHVIECNDVNPSPDACARKAVSENVAAVVGSFSLGINPILAQNGIPQVGPYPFNKEDYTQPNEFPVSGGSVSAGAVVKQLASENVHKIVPLAVIGAESTSSAVTFMKQTAEKTPGMEILPTIGLPFPSTELSAEVAKAAATEAEAMLVLALPAQNVQVLQAAQAAGVTQKLFFSGATFPQALVEQVGSAAEGVYTLSSFLPVSSETPGMKQFNQDMSEYAPGQELSDVSMNSWAAMQTFAIAAKKAKTIDPSGIMSVMPTLPTIELGITAPFSFAKPGPMPGAPRVVNVGTFRGQVKEGVITAVSEQPTPAYP